MPRIAVLGLGEMGRRMARRLLDLGYDLVVWSRSGVPEAAPRLRERAAPSPRAAAHAAEVIIAMVTDDAASRAVWTDPQTGALAALRPGAIAIESSTLTPAWVASLAERVRATGAEFLDAPVVGSRLQAEAGALIHLVGGTPATLERAREVLQALGSAAHHLGPTPSGAMMKLVVNSLFSAQVALLAELLGLARRARLDLGTAFAALGSLPVLSPAAKAAGATMLAARFEPMFPIELVDKDLRYALAAGESVGSELPVTQRTAELFARARAQGLGSENLTALAKLF